MYYMYRSRLTLPLRCVLISDISFITPKQKYWGYVHDQSVLYVLSTLELKPFYATPSDCMQMNLLTNFMQESLVSGQVGDCKQGYV